MQTKAWHHRHHLRASHQNATRDRGDHFLGPIASHNHTCIDSEPRGQSFAQCGAGRIGVSPRLKTTIRQGSQDCGRAAIGIFVAGQPCQIVMPAEQPGACKRHPCIVGWQSSHIRIDHQGRRCRAGVWLDFGRSGHHRSNTMAVFGREQHSSNSPCARSSSGSSK